MTFTAKEESVADGVPITLYFFRYGPAAGEFFALTDHDSSFVYSGTTYSPVAIGREEVEASGGLDNSTLELQIDPGAEIVSYLLRKPAGQVVSLTIYQGHANDTAKEFFVVWAGRVLSAARKDPWAEIAAEPVSTSLRRVGLRRHYQTMCPFLLYGPQCRADPDHAKQVRIIAGFGENYLDLSDGWNGGVPKGTFRMGYVEWDHADTGATIRRATLTVITSSDRIILEGDTDGLAEGATVSLFPGCAHSTSDCKSVHNNINNFGGQPLIPVDNPVKTKNLYF